MPAAPRIVFAIVGSGWRAEFYLRIAQALPDRFEVCGVVARTEERRTEIVASWHVPAFATIDDMLRLRTPDFAVVAVVRAAAPGIIEDLAGRGVPVLGETPPGADMAALERLHQLTRRGSRIQIAEQYHLQPMLHAQLAIAKSGELGMVSQASLSICHDHHAVSLVRKFLDVGFEDALVTAHEFVSPLVAGTGQGRGSDRGAHCEFQPGHRSSRVRREARTDRFCQGSVFFVDPSQPAAGEGRPGGDHGRARVVTDRFPHAVVLSHRACRSGPWNQS